MSKPVKQMITKVYRDRFEGVQSLALVNLTGVDANTNTAIRAQLREKDIHVTVVKNSLARKAFRDMGLETAAEALDGPCAVAYGADSVVTVVRELVDIRKKTKQLGIKAAVMEGNLFGEDRIEELSQYPTRDEAIANLLQAILSPGANVSGALMGPGGALAGCLKAIEEKEEGGE
ncbi:MAG: 50S ribosomal protein L10 [Phycisphaerae bacterium]